MLSTHTQVTLWLVATAVQVAMLVTPASAGTIVGSDFQGGEVVTTFDGLSLNVEANSTPLLITGNTFTTDNGMLRYRLDYGDVIGTTGGAVSADTSTGYIDIVLGVPAVRAGASIGAIGVSWDGEAAFFDDAGALIGTVVVSGLGYDHAFAGFESDSSLISRVRFSGPLAGSAGGRVLVLDDFVSEVPEPSTALGLALGVLALGWRQRCR